MASHFKANDIENLCDLRTPMTDYDKLVLLKVYGLDPPPREPQVRQPYDSLYLKQKESHGVMGD